MRYVKKTFVTFSKSLWIQLLLLFAAALALSSLPLFQGNREMRLNVGIVDADGSEESAALAKEAKKDALFSVRLYDSPADALNLVKSGALEALFVIRKGYAEAIKKGDYKGAIEAVYSPYSSSVKTLSDAFGTLVLRDMMREDAYNRVADKLPQLTAEEFGLAFDTAGSGILKLNTVSGGQPAAVKQPDGLSPAFYILSLAAMFYLLCAVKLPRNMGALTERIKRPAGFLFAYFSVHGAPFLVAGLALGVYFTFTLPLPAFTGLIALLLFLLAVTGLLLASSFLKLTEPARISLMAAYCLLNAVFAYPAGFVSASWLRFLFPAATLQCALFISPVYLLYSAAYAGLFLLLGTRLSQKKPGVNL